MATRSRFMFPSVLFLAALTTLSTSFAFAQETVLYDFSINANDSYFPIGDLVADKAGNLYGAAYGGGTYNSGTVFELIKPSTKDGAWTETILYSFTGGADGANPDGGVIFDRRGNLYGTTYNGGGESFPSGVVFELSPLHPARRPGPKQFCSTLAPARRRSVLIPTAASRWTRRGICTEQRRRAAQEMPPDAKAIPAAVRCLNYNRPPVPAEDGP